MKDYIDIEGSGQNVTLITGHPDGPATLVAFGGVWNAEIRFLKVENRGGGSLAVAIGTGSPINITQVTAVAKGAATNHAIENHCPSPPCDTVMMRDVYARVEDNNSTENVGIHSDDNSNVAMINVIAEVSGTVNGTAGANTTSVGIRNVNMAQITMMEVYAIVSGGANARGIRNNNIPSNSQMFNVYAFALDATGSNYGIFNTNSTPNMRNIRTEGSGGAESIGLSNNSCSVPIVMTSMVAHGHNATTTNIGILNNGCSHVYHSSAANTSPGKAGAAHYGIKNVDASPRIESSLITSPASDAVCGSGCYGVHNTSTGAAFTVRIDNSQIWTAPTSSSAATISSGANVTTYVGNSKLEGNAVQNAGTIKCVGSYNATYDPLNNLTCLP